MFKDLYLYRKAIPEKLLQYGFQEIENGYYFHTDILQNEFTLTIVIDENSDV